MQGFWNAPASRGREPDSWAAFVLLSLCFPFFFQPGQKSEKCQGLFPW